jgi:hypothetical protein
MASYTVLPWQNENSLTSYPLETPFELENFIVDASFIQFDAFVPVLKEIDVRQTDLRLKFQTDAGEIGARYFLVDHRAGKQDLRIFAQNNRYLGCLALGAGADVLWTSYVGQKLELNIKFLAHTVRSIPLKDAVYTLDSLYGDVQFDSAIDTLEKYAQFESSSTQLIPRGKTVFYNIQNTPKVFSFNAVKNHSVAKAALMPKALKKINLVRPVDNNVYIASNDVLKFTPFNGQRLNIALAGDSVFTSSSIVPTLAS